MNRATLEMTEALARDIVSFKLGRESQGTQMSLAAKTLRRTASELDTSHREMFANMLQAIAATSKDVSVSFKTIAENMFSDNIINWGRVTVLFIFSGYLAKHCETEALLPEPDVVALWLIEFVSTHLLQWIEEVGGWDSFNEHFKDKKDKVWLSDGLCFGLVASAAAFGAAMVFAR